MDKEKIARTIIEMTNEATSTGNQKLYWEVIGFVEGMRRTGQFPEDFAKLLETDIHDRWAERDRKMKERFKRMWRFSVC